MFKQARKWLEDRKLSRLPVSREQWEQAVAPWPVAARYQGPDRERLYDAALRFLLRKELASGGGFELNDAQRLLIATMAVVPVLELGLDWYDGWYTVIVYEDTFVTPDGGMDEFGVVHEEGRALAGEAWLQGPVILSWGDILQASSEDGYNVVLHELAHKLDMLDDGPNGAPPLHPGMDRQRWHEVFTNAWQALQGAEQRGEAFLDPYALEDPGEFFAVATESFFESPDYLRGVLPEVYDQLALFYRQRPSG
ncbi:zinc-dependent peptidase [Alloalcanivorax marinus]|uniref:M90 family metallopeptidase n=1 Tax=Alloalcanivorax marinus TaxID=1177169 RepID=UPI0019589E30|nr:M90 family metallopeptidase [Alloalcanivorax marinus]MBM7335579.1 zinc-dependent peptidase [Alloalcanivorax marinus]